MRFSVSLLALLLLSSAVFAGEKKDASAPAAHDPAEMAKWMEMASPSASHKQLEAMVGTWDTTVKMWMDPSQPPSETKGTSVNSMALGGRWLEQRFEGEMMGGPFHGIGYTGYDNYKKQYVGVWMDTASTAAMMTTGQAEGASKMTFTGSMDDPMSGQVVAMKETITVVDKDHHNFEMWMTGPDGKMFKTMEISYSRKG